ncbi:MAG: glycosyltransferase, partial [Sphingobium sp.]
SSSVIDRYRDDIHHIFVQEDSGIYSAMNFAIDQCSGDYIIFINAGDFFYSASSVSDVVRSMRGAPDVLHGDHVYVDGKLELHKKSAQFHKTRTALRGGALTPRWHDRFPCHQATFTKRSILEKLGKYDTSLEICADHHFLLRAYDAGASFQYVDVTVAHYTGGGLSARRADRCRMEFAHVYRNFSSYPQRVDRFFGIEPIISFDTQSRYTGSKVSGFFPVETHESEHGEMNSYAWCAGEGFCVLSPALLSDALILTGSNPHESQVLTIIHDETTVGTLAVPVGDFELTIPFVPRIVPGSLLHILPSRSSVLSEPSRRFVSILLRQFHFRPVFKGRDTRLKPGRAYIFGNVDRQDVESLLLDGWSPLEDRHVWSVGKSSRLAVMAAGKVSRLELTLQGNPWLSDAERKVTVLINGMPCLVDQPLLVTEQTLSIDLGDALWLDDDINLIEFQLKATAVPPANDHRALGICLQSLELGRHGP